MTAAVASLPQRLGDAVDFDVGALYDRYAGALQRFFGRRSLPPEDISDLTQEVFVRLLQHARLRGISRPQAFMFVTASNLSKDFARRRLTRATLRHVPLEDLDDETALVSSLPMPDAACESIQSLHSLSAALDELRPHCRHSLLSSRVYDQPYAVIARELGISTSMVEKHVSHAVAHCRQRLSQEPGT